MLDLLITNAHLATPQGAAARRGAAQGEIYINPEVNIGVVNGKFAYIGGDLPEARHVVDVSRRLVTPGLVDCHTHLVFGGSRHHEVPLKLDGADYMEILAAGGGILSTVEATRAASFEDLQLKAEGILQMMLRHGTTTVEAKSGYGLDFKTELKQMLVVEALQEKAGVQALVSTFMGAHAVPKEYKENPEEFVELLINDIIPRIAQTNLAEFCDIFCERGVFDVEQSRRIMQAAKDAGFKLKIHADEIVDLGGAALAAEMGAISAEHLIAASDEGLEALAKSDTVAVLLPTTSFYLGKPYARARKMLDLGIPVAIASDFNPGSSPNFNLQMSITLAYLKYRMNAAEILTGVTLNAACALGLENTKGTIEMGKDADLVVWDAPNLDYLLYSFGTNKVHKIIKNGGGLCC